MNIFVTGATGKIGSRFVPRLLQRGHNVSVLVRNVANIGKLAQGLHVIEGDLMQPDRYTDALKGVDVVVHLAAQFRGVDEVTAKVKHRCKQPFSRSCLEGGCSKVCICQYESRIWKWEYQRTEQRE
jgi:putative NADH-flavin reductase